MKPTLAIFSITFAMLTVMPAVRAEEAVPAPAPVAPAAAVLDFGDFSSETLTTKAWDAYNAKNFTAAKGFAQKCIDQFKDKAVEMQKGLTAPATVKEEVFKSWALNDVGTCHFILGQALEGEGKGKEALGAYKFLVDHLSFAQCWDAKGWFWKPADSARERVKVLEFEALK